LPRNRGFICARCDCSCHFNWSPISGPSLTGKLSSRTKSTNPHVFGTPNEIYNWTDAFHLMKYKNMHKCNRRDANCARGFYHHGCRVRN
jgi:hypothetical protein